MDLTEIGSRIKLARRKKKITQEKLADLVDVSPHYIYEIERGTKAMSLQTLEKISLQLHLSVDYLLWGDSAPDPEKNDKALRESDQLNHIINHLSASEKKAVTDVLSGVVTRLNH
ncbi:MAG: helix-turn-helix domain-containing protein [Lachnospiraceae bacterium]|nr:helix-turn-helix domain-containing protein [Lachnospiraceae bacterium]